MSFKLECEKGKVYVWANGKLLPKPFKNITEAFRKIGELNESATVRN